MSAWYNEIDPFCAQWLRNLIAAGHIAEGVVDERDIRDVRPSELAGFTQIHGFAGLGGWPLAARAAGWPDDHPLWTGSCPCQPFSAAGKRGGFADERHLWPAFHWHIGERRPDVVVGEQVSGKDGGTWLDLVFADMEELDYACGALVAPAAGVGAPHGRHRTYWLAHHHQGRSECPQRNGHAFRGAESPLGNDAGRCGEHGGVAHPNGRQRQRLAAGARGQRNGSASRRLEGDRQPECGGEAIELGDANLRRCGELRKTQHLTGEQQEPIQPSISSGATSFWRDAEWIWHTDNKWRPVEPGTFPLVDGYISRNSLLRAIGNAIVVEQAKVFLETVMEIL